MSHQPLVHFVVIGAMKAGTSSLHEQLALRPGLCMSEPKEPNFFSDDDRWQRGLDWYRSCFPGEAGDGRLRGESSTHYAKWPTHADAARRLHETLPEVRLVYVMRDPIERIVSQYIHEWSQREVAGSFEQAVRRHERFTAYSCYARQLEEHLAWCPPERILLAAFERLMSHPEEELRRICRFLGDPGSETAHWADREAENASAQRMRRSAFREGLLARPGVSWLKDRLPPGFREWLKQPWRMGRRPEVPEPLRRELAARIDPDLALLGRWTGLSLSCEGWREAVAEAPLTWRPGALLEDPPGGRGPGL